MALVFTSANQEHLFKEVRQVLIGLGYSDDRLCEGYRFRDWFDPDLTPRSVPLAAFAQYPFSYHTACFAVLLSDEPLKPDSILPYRALGAPYAIEVTHDKIANWAIGKSSSTTRQLFSGGPAELIREFKGRAGSWSAPELLRLKNISTSPTPRQLDLFDFGLIPELEKHVRTKLDAILKETLSSGIRIYSSRFGRLPDAPELYRLVFSLLAAKVLHDRDIEVFRDLSASDLDIILSESKAYYKPGGPLLDYRPTQQEILNGLWSLVSFENLSIDVLAYIWEHSLITESDRAEYSIYGTPYEVARNLIGRLPDEAFTTEGRLIVEPGCGHGVFLVAALQRLGDLLQPGMPSEQRHQRFVGALRGFDRDPFGVEVTRLCLSLADFPNRNGWKIYEENVFKSNIFDASIAQAKTVLCNPPFGNTRPGERPDRKALALRPAELLRLVLAKLPDDGLLGFVLPRKFTDGRGYKVIRRQLAERFADIEVVALPDKVFEDSGVEVETVLLACKSPADGHTSVQVAFTDASNVVWRDFRSHLDFPPQQIQLKSISDVQQSLEVMPASNLPELWAYLSSHKRIGDIAERPRRGVEWKSLAEVPKGKRKGREYRSKYRARYSSCEPKLGYEPGVMGAAGMKSFLVPTPRYVSVKPEDQHESHKATFLYPWDKPKVVVGAARGSRSRWRLKAAPDYLGRVFSQRFIAVWPLQPWSANSLAAVLNGPIASAFVSARESNRDNLRGTIEAIPIPTLDREQISLLDKLVSQYINTLTEMFPRDDELAIHLLLRIDAEVLRGYDLPPSIEHSALNSFRSSGPRPVDHPFGDYYPPDFESYIPLIEFISEEYRGSTVESFVRDAPPISDPTLLDLLSDKE
jgi:hypothetical protein